MQEKDYVGALQLASENYLLEYFSRKPGKKDAYRQ
jgi:hypothetical protein